MHVLVCICSNIQQFCNLQMLISTAGLCTLGNLLMWHDVPRWLVYMLTKHRSC